MAPPTTTIPQLPPRSAGPNAVRAYLTQILISKHDTTSEFAHKTANLWHLGRGAELRDSPPKVFRKLFGDYTGWVIYRIVYEDKLQEWKGSVVGLISSYVLTGAILFTVFTLLRVFVFNAWKPSSDGFIKSIPWTSVAFLATGLSMINYGLGTPSSNGVAIAICGSMIAMVAAVVRGLCLSEAVRGADHVKS